MTDIQPRVAPHPVVAIALEADGTVRLNGSVLEHQGDTDPREAAVHAVATSVATVLGRPVRAVASDSLGSVVRMVICPDGSVSDLEEITPAAEAPHLTTAVKQAGLDVALNDRYDGATGVEGSEAKGSGAEPNGGVQWPTAQQWREARQQRLESRLSRSSRKRGGRSQGSRAPVQPPAEFAAEPVPASAAGRQVVPTVTEVIDPLSRWRVPVIGASDVESETPVEPGPPEIYRPPVTAPRPARPVTPYTKQQPQRQDAPFVWVGAHGGAGETSLAIGSGVGVALTREWPEWGSGWPPDTVLVCRSNSAGLDAAARMIQEVLSGAVSDVFLHALVVVADAPGRLPKELKARIHELSGTVPHLVQVPWIAAWRGASHTAHPDATKAAAQVQSAITPNQ